MRLALCQINATVGDIAGNAERIARGLHDAREAGAELVLFPELALTGYPPEDLLLKEHFLADARSALEQLAGEAPDVVALVGFPERAEDVFYLTDFDNRPLAPAAGERLKEALVQALDERQAALRQPLTAGTHTA